MMFFKQSLLILKRDLKIEFRNKSLLLSMIIFAVLFQVFLQIVFDANIEAIKKIAAGVLWIPILLSALLGFSKYGIAERENDALTGLLIAPVDRGAIFLGKLLGNLLFVFIVVIISVPVFFLFLKQPFPESIGLLLFTLFLGSWGFVALGVFFTTLAQSSSITDLLVPIMIFPLAVPLFLAISQLTEMALYPSIVMGQDLWVLLLVGYNILFTIAPLFLFDILLEV
ncbi:heme exporter protein CcmB [Aquibacillus sp. 3ASR75-11]|uniref:Heme exporter protein CcmB n=1 Tax=Terrihalobacillus insolitus TaxID=2950438 RepID=A0A9X4AMW1_9BACI|nr:heme exporter protein CcmB [Terrihalobacillus insolitus]MDC3414552.1 heme exporter protein CcmB [Terrihalobacillus insolitus]MDC3425771.1 heme exporter protein CcmB [Terrihalobacillus insolitus]